MAADSLRPAGAFELRLAAVRAHSASCGAARVRRALLDRLAVEKRDRVLELGFGSGRLLFAVAARATEGLVAGVEPEETALRHAGRRCERLVRDGRVTLLRGSSHDLSLFATGAFDKVYGVHVTHFWDEPLPHLREIRRVLRPGGRLLLGSCAGEPLAADLVAAGFREIRTEPGRPAWTAAH
jgi:ubiquinone/menaquinone biosynthesis C-methylase UbiE